MRARTGVTATLCSALLVALSGCSDWDAETTSYSGPYEGGVWACTDKAGHADLRSDPKLPLSINHTEIEVKDSENGSRTVTGKTEVTYTSLGVARWQWVCEVPVETDGHSNEARIEEFQFIDGPAEVS